MNNDNARAARAHIRKLRKELAAMLGYDGDPDALPIDQSMRLDVVMNLKCALDEQRGRLYRGEAIDSAEMLRLSEALDRYLPKHPEPVDPDPFEGVDPKKKLAEIVTRFFAAKTADQADKAAERRAKGLPEPFTDLDAAQARIDELEALLAGDVDRRGDAAKALTGPTERVIDPPTSAITPPGEIGELRRDMPRGPDDHKVRRPGPVIDGEIVKSKPAPPALTVAEANERDDRRMNKQTQEQARQNEALWQGARAVGGGDSGFCWNGVKGRAW